MVAATLSDTNAQVLGYLGGAILASCLVPQIAKLVRTRSAGDIAVLWMVLYIIGLSLTLAYLIHQKAYAAWIPLVFEITGCITIIVLKILFDHTRLGRNNGPAAAFAAASRAAAAVDVSKASSTGGRQVADSSVVVVDEGLAEHVCLHCGQAKQL